MATQLIWLIFLLPVISFLIIALLIRPFVNKESRIAGYLAILAIGTSLVLSLMTLSAVMSATNHEIAVPDINWLTIGNLNVRIGLMVDSLTAVMLVVVTLVSLMVQVYSLGYMKDNWDHGNTAYHRYYAWMSLFTASMLGVILANSLLLIFVFWEMVGLCSYLLIGFWFHRTSAANAAKKAFIVTRFGDFGFLAAILLIFARTHTFDIATLYGLAGTAVLTGSVLTWAAIGIFTGAMGKSAQFPLHLWLPDAMEGPTPVSALIHAATMVAAGVFLVARTLPIFVHSVEALTTVAIIGAVTAIFAASMGLVMSDIKRVVAYSTISQLGYMMLGLGAAGIGIARGGDITVEAAKAAAAVGIFHLFNHAFFKALLFLGAGSVNHATSTFDMRLMGGLRKVMPWTFATFLIASLSLAGIWPLSGFWSKDEILAVALKNEPVLFVLALITVFMTAFYIFRVLFLTFGGEYRGGAQEVKVAHGAQGDHDPHGGHVHEVASAMAGHSDHDAHAGHLHESAKVMVAPMVVLSILAVATGWWNSGGGFARFMGETNVDATGFFGVLTHPLPWISLIVAGLGILLAYAMYSRKVISAEKIGSAFKPLYTLFSHKYYFDELYENVIVKISLIRGLFAGLEKIDTYIVEGAVNTVAGGAYAEGKALRKLQTGQLQLYGLAIGIGILAIILVLYLFG